MALIQCICAAWARNITRAVIKITVGRAAQTKGSVAGVATRGTRIAAIVGEGGVVGDRTLWVALPCKIEIVTVIVI